VGLGSQPGPCDITQIMSGTRTPTLTSRYERAAGGWGDKMRTLGYGDAYLDFLAAPPHRADPSDRICDVGCGTGTFAEAWVGVYGPPAQLTLLDPSPAMLTRAETALHRRGAATEPVPDGIDTFHPAAPFDHLLTAHVLEHVEDPVAALQTMRTWVYPGARLWLIVSKPHWCNAIIWLQWRHRAYRSEDVAAMLADAGWHLDSQYTFPSGPPSRTSRGYRAIAS